MSDKEASKKVIQILEELKWSVHADNQYSIKAQKDYSLLNKAVVFHMCLINGKATVFVHTTLKSESYPGLPFLLFWIPIQTRLKIKSTLSSSLAKFTDNKK